MTLEHSLQPQLKSAVCWFQNAFHCAMLLLESAACLCSLALIIIIIIIIIVIIIIIIIRRRRRRRRRRKRRRRIQQSWCGRIHSHKTNDSLTNHNNTNIKILLLYNNKKFYTIHPYNVRGLKILLIGFLKVSMSWIDLICIWFSRAFQRINDLGKHDFPTISVFGLGNIKVIFLLRSKLPTYYSKRQFIGHGKRW